MVKNMAVPAWLYRCAAVLALLLIALPGAAPAESSEKPSERIVSLEYTETEMLLALEVVPVGAADIEGYRKWVDIRSESLVETQDVGQRQEPSFEALLELQPDLILAPAFRHRAIRERLEEIAPTILVETQPEGDGESHFTQMQDSFRQVARLLGREKQASAVLAHLEEELTAQRERIERAGVSGTSVAFVYPVPGSNLFRLFTPNALVMETAERIGLDSAPTGSGESFGFRLVGIETLAELPSKTVVLLSLPQEAEVRDQVEDAPVWQALPFVKEGRLRRIEDPLWPFGGPLSTARLAQRLADSLLQDSQ